MLHFILEILFLIWDVLKNRSSNRYLLIVDIAVYVGFLWLIYQVVKGLDEDILMGYRDASVNILSILVGFSITLFTILNTSGNQKIEKIEKFVAFTLKDKTDISLFKFFNQSLSFVIFAEGLLLIFVYLFPVILDVYPYMLKIFAAINIFGVVFVILENIKMIVRFYHILNKEG